jgi:hypothetical protein
MRPMTTHALLFEKLMAMAYGHYQHPSSAG